MPKCHFFHINIQQEAVYTSIRPLLPFVPTADKKRIHSSYITSQHTSITESDTPQNFRLSWYELNEVKLSLVSC